MPDESQSRGRAVHLNSERIVDLRLARGITRSRLAAMAQISERTLDRAERGTPIRLETAARIAKALNAEFSSIVATQRPPAENLTVQAIRFSNESGAVQSGPQTAPRQGEADRGELVVSLNSVDVAAMSDAEAKAFLEAVMDLLSLGFAVRIAKHS